MNIPRDFLSLLHVKCVFIKILQCFLRDRLLMYEYISFDLHVIRLIVGIVILETRAVNTDIYTCGRFFGLSRKLEFQPDKIFCRHSDFEREIVSHVTNGFTHTHK